MLIRIRCFGFSEFGIFLATSWLRIWCFEFRIYPEEVIACCASPFNRS